MTEKEKKISIVSPTKNENKSKQKIWLLLGGFTALIIAIGSLTLDRTPPPAPRKIHSDFIDLTPGEDKDWRTEMQIAYREMVRSNEKIEENTDRALDMVSQALEEIRQRTDELTELKETVGELKNRAPVERIVVNDNGQFTNSVTPAQQDENDLQRRISEQLNELKEIDGVVEENETGQKQNPLKRVLPPPPGVPYSKIIKTEEDEVETMVTYRAPKTDSSPIIFKAKEEDYDITEGTVDVEATYVENEYAGYLPPGAFADIVLLSGLDSGTSEYTRANPQPVLMRVSSNAQLPQGKYFLKSCFVLGSSYGDLSSERVFIQLSRITCVDKARGLMLTGSLSGYVTDSDSIQGLKGTVTRRNGQLLGKAMLAGFASGLSEIAASAGTTQVQTIGGAINSTIDTDQILQTGGAKGIGTTMEMIAQNYLDEAKNLFPILTITGGRIGGMVLTNGTKLEWKSYSGKYQKNVKPASMQQSIF